MKLRPLIFLLLAAFSSAVLSACTTVESKTPEEVVIEDTSKGGNEIVINNSDIKTENKQISTSTESAQLPKRILSDGSNVETLIDGFGNKTETRYFPGHLRVRFIIVRTSVDGKQQVTVYGYGDDTKTLADLGDIALTASGDEIANAAGLFVTRTLKDPPNFMKKRKTEIQPPLQPLPSSQFQKPLPQVLQPAETVQPETENSSENPSIPQNQTVEN